MNDDTRLHDDELREVAQRLGARAAERLDVERTAQAVVTRLRTEPRADVRVLGWIQPVWLRIAALLVLAAGAGVIGRSLLPGFQDARHNLCTQQDNSSPRL